MTNAYDCYIAKAANNASKTASLQAGVAPCKGCEKRHVGCHSVCKDYLTWKRVYAKAKNDAINRASIDYASYSRSDASAIYGFKQGKHAKR